MSNTTLVREKKYSPSILLAEDDLLNQEVTVEMLELIGCLVKVVENGHELLDVITNTRFDLILMDCEMPKMDGFQVTKKIRHREFSTGRHVPVIALTAHALNGYKEKCLLAGMDDYLSKPFSLQQLKEIVWRWIE